MKKVSVLSALILAMAIALPAGAGEAEALAHAKGMVKELGMGLKKELKAAVKASGFGGAVSACGDVAQERAVQISEKHGATIHRVSLKLRNPANEPDEYERGKLMAMERDLAKGALKGAYFETVETNGSKAFRFMKPIVTVDFCLNCHGDSARIDKDAAAALARLYPEDKATGYKEKQIRGAFSVSIPMGK